MRPMNPGIKALWIEALESGEYKQGKNLLRSEGGDGAVRYCCLGVLCELAETAGVVIKVNHTDSGVTRYASVRDETDRDASVLPHAVMTWAEMESEVGTFADGIGQSLVELNDNGRSFVEIAEIIRREF